MKILAQIRTKRFEKFTPNSTSLKFYGRFAFVVCIRIATRARRQHYSSLSSNVFEHFLTQEQCAHDTTLSTETSFKRGYIFLNLIRKTERTFQIFGINFTQSIT